MRKALLITVGTGVGNKRDALESLSDGIAYCLKQHNPTKTVFIVTEESERDTLPLIIEKTRLNTEEYEIKRLKSMDDIELIYEDCVRFIKELLNTGFDEKDIVVDYTSGTKAMSVGLGIAAATMDIENFSYISGKRVDGKVVKGTERIMPIRAYKILADNKLKIVRNLFNKYQFDACFDILQDLKKKFGEPEFQEILKEYENVCYAFSKWDRFDHKEAKKRLTKIQKLDINLASNNEFLNEFVSSQEYFIADLLANAERRGEEGKYDDAVARLYRTMELIAQYRLYQKYGINTSDVDLQKIPASSKEWLLESKNSEGKIQIGLQKDYRLLKDFDDELGIRFSEDEELKSLLGTRNSSILAHGRTPVTKKHYKKLFEKVIGFAQIVVPNVLENKEKAKFAKFKT